MNNQSNDTIGILTEKLSKAEDSALKSFKANNDECAALKTLHKNREHEANNLKQQNNSKGKAIKEKEREIYRLDQKSSNLEDTVK